MVNYQPRDLDRIFGALGDPTRRAMLARLDQHDGLAITELAAPFSVKLPAVMKHLQVLGDAGLVTRAKHGRTVTIRLAPDALRAANAWLARYERFWTPALDRLTAYAEAEELKACVGEAGTATE